MSLFRKVLSFGSFTLISRIFGYIRDFVLASRLGTGGLNDAFVVAFRLPNLFRSIFAEGALNNSFVPIYSSESDALYANQFAANIRNILMVILLVLTVVAELFMPAIVYVLAPGLADDPAVFANAVLFSRITFSYIFFISLTSLYGSIMNSHGKFIPYASAPILLNIAIIGAVLSGNYFANDAFAASVGIFIAGILQLLWMISFMRIYGVRLPLGNFRLTPNTKLMLRRMLPIIISSGFVQINLVVDNIFASLENSAISYLYYANRLSQLPLSLVGISLGVVILPELAKHFKAKSEQALTLQSKAFYFAILLGIPASFALALLAPEIITVLLQRGEFDVISSSNTAKALAAYALGLPAWIAHKVMIANFHSRGETKYPLKISTYTIALNVLLNAVLFYTIGFAGIALASSISVYVNVGLLGAKASADGYLRIERDTVKILIKASLASLAMVGLIKMVTMFIGTSTLLTLTSFGVGGAFYLSIIYLSERIR